MIVGHTTTMIGVFAGMGRRTALSLAETAVSDSAGRTERKHPHGGCLLEKNRRTML